MWVFLRANLGRYRTESSAKLEGGAAWAPQPTNKTVRDTCSSLLALGVVLVLEGFLPTTRVFFVFVDAVFLCFNREPGKHGVGVVYAASQTSGWFRALYCHDSSSAPKFGHQSPRHGST